MTQENEGLVDRLEGRLEEYLRERDPARASQLAEAMGAPLPEVNIALGANPRLFQKDTRTLKWSMAERRPPSARRPGPFGPARDLIPEDQELAFLQETESVRVALSIMADSNFSAMPVVDGNDRIIGMFCHSSFATRCLQLAGVRAPLVDEKVGECMTAAEFIHPDTYIDTTTDWSQNDNVIVGTAEEPLGILTLSDVWAVLNDFAEAFVLLFEIERDLRSLIEGVLGDRVSEVCEEINNNASRPNQRRVGVLEEFTFREYELAVTKRERYALFDEVLGVDRKILLGDFTAVSGIRNDVFHFRRQVTPRDTGHLRAFLDRMRRGLDRLGAR